MSGIPAIKLKPLPSNGFSVGDRVVITEGPPKNRYGKVIRSYGCWMYRGKDCKCYKESHLTTGFRDQE
jgi:uncharacterized protein YodC (DUF2158 family)